MRFPFFPKDHIPEGSQKSHWAFAIRMEAETVEDRLRRLMTAKDGNLRCRVIVLQDVGCGSTSKSVLPHFGFGSEALEERVRRLLGVEIPSENTPRAEQLAVSAHNAIQDFFHGPELVLSLRTQWLYVAGETD
jgi:hypothetical protein